MILLEKKPKPAPAKAGFMLVPVAPDATAGASLTGHF
jgi:hypothetical protein